MDLKPCPFCGGEAQQLTNTKCFDGSYLKTVSCTSCHASIIGLNEEAAAKWNSRAQHNDFTYSSSQATCCAECGEYKHTPLRVDRLGGYVCLTCIDKNLEQLIEQKTAIIKAIDLLPTGEWDNPGMGFSPEWIDYTANRYRSELLAKLNV